MFFLYNKIMPDSSSDIQKLTAKIAGVEMPEDLREKVNGMVARLEKLSSSERYLIEFERTEDYIDWICSLPWDKRTKDALDLGVAKEIFEKNHYGLQDVKERILEYLSVLKLQGEGAASASGYGEPKKFSRAPILCLVGLVGTGKTTLAKSIAESMGREFARIPFGGIGDTMFLRGQSRAYDDAEPGQIIKSLKICQSKNPVVLLDEIDRVDEKGRSSVMGALVELLDPEQNARFTDHFLDFPFDLSEVLFVATCNNTGGISTAVMDRMEVIQMPSYSDEEKTIIAKRYLFPQTMKEFNIPESSVTIAEDIWPKIVRPLGFDAGIRTLERTIQGLLRKVARQIVEGKQTQFNLDLNNVKEFLPSY
jgi:ATP-dependent Lon protease